MEGATVSHSQPLQLAQDPESDGLRAKVKLKAQAQGRDQDSVKPRDPLDPRILGRVRAPHMREGCDPQGTRGQRPKDTAAQELMPTPCAARPGLALGISAGRASASRALGSGSEQRLDKYLLV